MTERLNCFLDSTKISPLQAAIGGVGYSCYCSSSSYLRFICEAELRKFRLDFSDGPVTELLPADAGDTGFIPDPGRFHSY